MGVGGGAIGAAVSIFGAALGVLGLRAGTAFAAGFVAFAVLFGAAFFAAAFLGAALRACVFFFGDVLAFAALVVRAFTDFVFFDLAPLDAAFFALFFFLKPSASIAFSSREMRALSLLSLFPISKALKIPLLFWRVGTCRQGQMEL
jgi:hypothetical protein